MATHTSPTAPGATHTAPTTQDSLSSPIREEKGDIAQLLLERLDAWKHATGYLEEYVEATAHLHKSISKDYGKVVKTVTEPLREGHHFAQSNGGVASFFENIRQNTQAIENSQLETEKRLKGEVLPTLNRLHKEIKNKHSELSSGAVKGSKAVEKSRGLTQKQIEHLGQHTASFESAGGRIEPDQDPYIIQRGVQHHLHRQLLDENSHRKDLVDVQSNFLTFEKHVIQTIQSAMGAFFQTVGGQCDKTKSLYGDITTNAQNMPQEFEWTNFMARSGDILVDPKTPNRTLDMIKFPNQDHRATQPLVQGLLQRKGKIMKSYDTYHYAVSPAGYFHEFSKSNDFKEHPEAELSLYLPECTIGAPPSSGEAKFIISGKDANKNQRLTGKHEFAFKANSYDEAMRWYNAIEPFTTGKLTRQNSLATTMSPTSPTSPQVAGETAVLHGTGEKPQQPHIDTNVTNAPTTASPAGVTPAEKAPLSAGPHSAAPHSATAEKAPLSAAPASATAETAPGSAAPASAEPASATTEKKKHGFFHRS